MHNIFIPISIEQNQNRQLTVKRLRDMGAKRVFLSIDRLPFYKGDYLRKKLEIVADAKNYYENAGFEVAFWTLSFGFGGGEAHYNREIAKEFTPIRSIEGKDANGAFCPTNQKFLDALLFGLKELAKLKPKIIMLDDEMCLSVRPGIGCACDNHLAMLKNELGKDIELCDIENKVFCGKPNKYRKAWFKVMGKTMRDFCSAVREAIDSVDSSIRVGFCAGYTSWDFEGADANTLTKILAGDQKPFLRYTGAPYWVEANRFPRITQASIIESVRMQKNWVGDDVEAFIEGDSFPRHRFSTSAAQCEIFDLALRGFCGFDSLKYPFCYSMQPDYDSGYYNSQANNKAMFNALKNTSGEYVGLRVYEYMSKIENADLPDEYMGHKILMERFYFPHAQKFLSNCGIPTVYSTSGVCGVTFGENARYIEESDLKNGMILDLKAALILKQRGIDVGLKSYKKLDKTVCEWHAEDKSTVELYPCGPIYELELSGDAKPQGYFKSIDIIEDYSFPSCYYYENKNGQRFFVYAWSGFEQRNDSVMFNCYYRSEQIQKAIELLTGDKLDVTADVHPHLYSLCKKDKNTVYAVYFNIHPDQINDFRVKTKNNIKDISVFGANIIEKTDNCIVIDKIAPFGCVFITIKF